MVWKLSMDYPQSMNQRLRIPGASTSCTMRQWGDRRQASKPPNYPVNPANPKYNVTTDVRVATKEIGWNGTLVMKLLKDIISSQDQGIHAELFPIGY